MWGASKGQSKWDGGGASSWGSGGGAKGSSSWGSSGAAKGSAPKTVAPPKGDAAKGAASKGDASKGSTLKGSAPKGGAAKGPAAASAGKGGASSTTSKGGSSWTGSTASGGPQKPGAYKGESSSWGENSSWNEKSASSRGDGYGSQSSWSAGSSSGGWQKPAAAQAAPSRPAEAAGASKSSGATSGNTPALTVSTNSVDRTLGISTLVGDFAEEGTNHGRKVYKKVQVIPGHTEVKVYLYYWDTRDGNDFSGWWFGDQVGGSQVWARAPAHGPLPPKSGWKVPWDSDKVEPGLLTIESFKSASSSQGGAEKGKAAGKSAGKDAGKLGAKDAPAEKGYGKSGKGKESEKGYGKDAGKGYGKDTGKGGGKDAGKGAASGGASWSALEVRVKKVKSLVESMTKSTEALAGSAKDLTPESGVEALKTMIDSIQREQKKLTDAQKTLTQDIAEARQGGSSTVSMVAELTKMSPTLRTLNVRLTNDLKKIQGMADEADQQAAAEEEAKALQEFEADLPSVQEDATAACDAVDAVKAMTTPIIDDPPENGSEDLQKALDGVEKAAAEAQKKLASTRQKLTQKLQSAKKFAPNASKTAVAELTKLQRSLGEAQKALTPLKMFKKEYPQRLEAKKALKEITEQIAEVEVEVEKASSLTVNEDKSHQMTEEELKSAQETVEAAKKSHDTINQTVTAKLRANSGATRDELTSMQGRLGESTTKLDAVFAYLKQQEEGLSLQTVCQTATEKVATAEASMEKCGHAELPFLKGIEILPDEESKEALAACAKAASEATSHLMQARNFIRSKMAAVKQYSNKEMAKKAVDGLTELQQRADATHKKLQTFKEETKERKVAALVATLAEVVSAAESKGKSMIEAGKVFAADLEETSVEALKEAGEKVIAAEKEYNEAAKAAKQAIHDKAKESKDPDTAQGLSKLSNRLVTMSQEVAQVKKDAAAGDKLVQGKETAMKAEALMAETEQEIEKLVTMSKPKEDLGEETVADEIILQLESIHVAAIKNLKAVKTMVSPHLTTAPAAVTALLKKISERTGSAQTKIDEVKAATKSQRERVVSESYAKQAEEKTKEAEDSCKLIDDAEGPYLKGVEVLPFEEGRTAMSAATEACQKVQTALGTVRTFIAKRNVELKSFAGENAKSSMEEIAKLTERINAIAQKLSTFKKETAARKKKVQLQEAAEKVKSAEEAAQKLTEAMKPMLEKDADEMSAEEAAATVKSVDDLEASVRADVDETTKFLAERSRDAKGDEEAAKQVQELEAKMAAVQSELEKAKNLSSNHSQKLKAKALIQEAKDKVKGMEDEMEKITAACAPLVEEKCERFLVKLSISTLCTALKAVMEEKTLDDEGMLKKMGNPVNEGAFVAFVAKMPEEFAREECAFSEERRKAMFKSIDADGDGKLSIEEFKAMFTSRYVCVHEISVTDAFDISSSKVVCKLQIGEALECTGEQKAAAGGVPRAQCKILSSGASGWVTFTGNSGTKYLDPVSPFNEFAKELQTSLAATSKGQGKVTGFFVQKGKELSTAQKDSPLAAAREELVGLRSKVAQLTKALESLKQKVQQAKQEYPALEAKEKNAHIEARERKEADAILAPAVKALSGLEAEFKKLEEAAKPLTDRHGTDLLAEFDKPVSVQEETKAIEGSVKEHVEEAKKVLKAQAELVSKASKGPLLEAKKELQKQGQATSQFAAKANKLIFVIKACLKEIADAKLKVVATAMRAEMQSKSLAADDYFSKLAGAGNESIAEDAFARHLQGLPDLKLSQEVAKLITQKIEPGNIGRRSFMCVLQQFFKVVTEIAVTPGFGIDSKEKPVRKVEPNEIVMLVEGPRKDEKTGLERIKGKALRDGAQGWISLRGNQGKVFLEETTKPFYTCLKDIPLEKEAKSSSDNSIRQLKADEVLELIGGPCQETLSSISRMRVKASQDGKVGWITLKDSAGMLSAEKDTKRYTCTSTVAITDVFEIAECKVVKKLAVGEAFIASEGIVEGENGMKRVKGKSASDDAEGWVTIQGNAGTAYAALNDKAYTVTREVSLQAKFASDSATTRSLSVGEIVEMQEAPKEEKPSPVNRIQVRTSGDHITGWVTVSNDGVRSWTSSSSFIKAGTLYASKGSKESIVRGFNANESLEILDGPFECDGAMWLKARLKKDQALGWTPTKNDEGEKLFKSPLG